MQTEHNRKLSAKEVAELADLSPVDATRFYLGQIMLHLTKTGLEITLQSSGLFRGNAVSYETDEPFEYELDGKTYLVTNENGELSFYVQAEEEMLVPA